MKKRKKQMGSDFRNEVLNQIELDQVNSDGEDSFNVTAGEIEEERDNGYYADDIEERKVSKANVRFERETATQQINSMSYKYDEDSQESDEELVPEGGANSDKKGTKETQMVDVKKPKAVKPRTLYDKDMNESGI